MSKTFWFVLTFLTLAMIADKVNAENKEEAKPLCDEASKMEQVLSEKGYYHLLDMRNENGVNQQLWSGGRSMVITAENDKKICLVSQADNVTFNAVTLQKIIEIFKKTQKDI